MPPSKREPPRDPAAIEAGSRSPDEHTHAASARAHANTAHAEQQWLQEATLAIGAGEHERAHRACMAVLQSAASGASAHHAEALLLLATIALAHGNAAVADTVVQRAFTIPDLPIGLTTRLLACSSRARSAQRLHDAALVQARRGAALGPTDAQACDTFGVAFARAGDHAAALPLFTRAVERAPTNAAYRYNLATALQFTGDLAAAELAYRQTLALDPSRLAAYPALAQLCPARDEPLQRRVESMLAERETADDADGCLLLGHALATLQERCGDIAGSMAALARAKQRKRAALRHDPGSDAALFEAATALLRLQAGHSTLTDDAPLFVFGLPRSGTTLVERILDSHPQVHAAGELGDFSVATKAIARTPGNAVLDAATLRAAATASPTALGTDYLARTRRHLAPTGSPDAPQAGGPATAVRHFVDKMPLNFFHAALIHRALPNARMVCLRRQPMDACLGNYRQLFATGFSYYNYAFDLGHAARYVAHFERYVDALRLHLPADRLLVFDYDAFVADQERHTRALLAFCGLPWDPACLQFHRNASAVSTASSVQVRRPLDGSASGRWQAWRELLGPARSVFAAAGIAID